MDDVNIFLEPLSVEDFATNQIKVFPNPASSIINIENLDDHVIDKVAIFDSVGKKVLDDMVCVTNYLAIDIGSLLPGIYFIEITTDNETVRKKIIKSN